MEGLTVYIYIKVTLFFEFQKIESSQETAEDKKTTFKIVKIDYSSLGIVASSC